MENHAYDMLTNLFRSSNKDKDPTGDETTTGDFNNKHTVSGEGSHFGSGRTTGNDPLSSSTNPTSATGSNFAGTGTHGLTEPHSSRMPGSFDDDAATTASVSSGVPGRAQTGNPIGSGAYNSGLDTNKPLPTQPGTSGSGLTGSGVTGSGVGSNTNTGPHSSNLENKLDPRVDSDLDGRSGLGGNTNTGTGSGLTGSTAPSQGQEFGSGTDTGRSFPLGGSSTTGTNTGSNTGYKAPGQVGTYPAGSALGGSTGTGSGSSTTGTSRGLGSNTTAGPHSSNLENKLDPRIDSDLDGRSGLGNTNTGTTGATSTGYGSGTGPTAAPGNSGHLGRDTGLGAGTGAVAGGAASGYGTESWEHKHGGHSHTYEGDPCGPESAAPGAPHFTSGPHATDTANRLDPHVSSGIGAPSSTTGTSSGSGLGSSGTGTGLGSSTARTGTGLGSSTTGTSTDPYGTSATGTGHHAGRDAALGAGAGAAGLGAYEAGRDHTQSSSTGPAPTTAGPHKSDMLNKLDPRVDSDLSKQQPGTTGARSGLGSSTTGTSSVPEGSYAGTGHHAGRDTAVAGGAGAAGLGAYEAEKHHHQHEPTTTSSTSGLGSATTEGAPHHSHHQKHHDRQQHAGEHHHARDAGLAGAGTAAAYEAERHHGHPTQSSTIPSTTGGMTSSSRDPVGSGYDNQAGTGHHYGRDAGVAGAGGVGAYEAEKHLTHRDAAGERLAGSGHHSNTTTSGAGPTGVIGNTGTTGTQGGITGSSQHDHHLGRDAAVGTGVAGAGYEADKHHQDKEARKLEHEREKEQSHDSGKKSGGIMGLFHRDKGDKEAKKEERAEEKAERKAEHSHHTGRDAALGAGAAGTAYEADKHHQHTHGRGDEEMAGGAGAVGLESDMRNTNLDGKHHHHGAGHTMTGSSDYEHGSQAGVHDSAISSGSGVAGIGGVHDSGLSSGSGVAGVAGVPTTHDA